MEVADFSETLLNVTRSFCGIIQNSITCKSFNKSS